MNVLALCSYPVEAACTRYRLCQFIEPLKEKEINLTISPFLSKEEFAALYQHGRNVRKAARFIKSVSQRLFDVRKAQKFDLIIIQREAMIIGPPIFEWLFQKFGNCPLILDLDDATYLSYISPTYGRMGSWLKFFGKTDKLIELSETVICGNRFIAEYIEQKGKKAVIVPTVVDTDKFFPVEKQKSKPCVIGWIGTHSTFPFLESLFPVLSDLARKYEFTLKIVGAGKDDISVDSLKIENLPWSLEREIQDFQSLDIGLYPLKTTDLVDEKWLLGKSGFKAIQYLSIGIPFVVSPIGVAGEIGIENETHYTAVTYEQWYKALEKLIQSFELRQEMGAKGRNYALEHFTVSRQAEKIADALYEVIETFNQRK